MKLKKNDTNAQGFFIIIVISLFLFIMGVMVLNIVKDDIPAITSVSGLNCDDTTISDGKKLTCLTLDLTIPYLALTIFSITGGSIISRVIE